MALFIVGSWSMELQQQSRDSSTICKFHTLDVGNFAVLFQGCDFDNSFFFSWILEAKQRKNLELKLRPLVMFVTRTQFGSLDTVWKALKGALSFNVKLLCSFKAVTSTSFNYLALKHRNKPSASKIYFFLPEQLLIVIPFFSLCCLSFSRFFLTCDAILHILSHLFHAA